MTGAELTDFVLILNTKEAVKTFSQGGNVTLGGNVSGKINEKKRKREKECSSIYILIKQISCCWTHWS